MDPEGSLAKQRTQPNRESPPGRNRLVHGRRESLLQVQRHHTGRVQGFPAYDIESLQEIGGYGVY